MKEGKTNYLVLSLFLLDILFFRLDESPTWRRPQIFLSHQVLQQQEHQVGSQASLHLVFHQKKDLNHLLSPHQQKTTKVT